mmetsp:Transcript_21369/g.31694  ORF Transcript_21369/g.31694 Transcript_21369/m.31694 type:complete len:83 (-) Transcript_21369:67-315(-)
MFFLLQERQLCATGCQKELILTARLEIPKVSTEDSLKFILRRQAWSRPLSNMRIYALYSSFRDSSMLARAIIPYAENTTYNL